MSERNRRTHDGQNRILTEMKERMCFFCLKKKYGCNGLHLPELATASDPRYHQFARMRFAVCRQCVTTPRRKLVAAVTAHIRKEIAVGRTFGLDIDRLDGLPDDKLPTGVDRVSLLREKHDQGT